MAFVILACVFGCHPCEKLNDNHKKTNRFDLVYLSSHSDQIFHHKMRLTSIENVKNTVTVTFRQRNSIHWKKRRFISFITLRYCADKTLRQQMGAGTHFMNVITNEKKQAILNINVDIFRCYSFLNFNVSKEKQYSKTQKNALYMLMPCWPFNREN